MNSILVIRGGALGDFVVTLPACRLLRERWPDARIDFLGNPSFAELGFQRFYFNHLRSLERGSLARFFVPNSALDSEWSDYFSEFDLIVSYLYDPDDFFHSNLKRCSHGEIIRGSPQVTTAPAAKHFCDPLKVLDLSGTDYGSRIFLSNEEIAFAETFLGGPHNRTVSCHPGSGSVTKNWPLDKWRLLCDELRLAGYTLLLVGGEADERELNFLRPQFSLQAIHLPLVRLASVLQRSCAYIGHDTGITHLAAAVQTPTVALFGPTDPQIWAPPAEHVTILKANSDWSGIDVPDVLNALKPSHERSSNDNVKDLRA